MKKRVSIFGRKDMSGKPPWGEDGGVLETVGEGFFWKKGQSIPHNWRRRDYKLRSDAMLFYFDGGKLRGCADLTDISICAGNDKNADKAGAASQQAIPVDLFSVSESKNFELVFGGKDSTDAFCMQLMKVTANTAGVEKFVRDFHWKEANRLLGEYEMDDEDDCERATTMTSVAGYALGRVATRPAI